MRYAIILSLYLQMECLKWTLSGLVIISFAFTYFASVLTTSEPEVVEVQHKYRLAHARHFKAARQAQRELEEKRRQTLENGFFQFERLPAEIHLLLLSFCAEWNATYVALLHVSRRMQHLTLFACLPRMPIILTNGPKISSFATLILTRPELENHIRHLWIAPEKGYSRVCSVILQKCISVRSLAINERLLQEAVVSSQHIKHLDCKILTLLVSSQNGPTRLLEAPGSAAFLGRLTHLRVYGPGDTIPLGVQYNHLTHLSYHDNRAVPTISIDEEALGEKDKFPLLRTVILSKRRGCGGGLRISRASSTKLYMFEIPERWTEMEMWRDSVRRRGMWDLC